MQGAREHLPAHMFTSASLIVRFSSIHRSTALDAALSRLVGG